MTLIGIYKIVSPSGKIYIGQSRNVTNRFKTYLRKACSRQTKLYASLNKYTPDKHDFSVIEEFDDLVTQEQMNEREKFHIQYYKNKGVKLLNLRNGGKDGKWSEETIERIRIGKSNPSEATRRKISEAGKRRFHSKEERLKISKSGIGLEHKGKPVFQYEGGFIVKKWKSVAQVARAFDVNRHIIRDLCLGKKSNLEGYEFRFTEVL